MIKLAKWDTDNFKIKVGNLYLAGKPTADIVNAEIDNAKVEGYDLLYLKGEDLPNDCLNSHVFLADVKVVYTMTVDSVHKADSHVFSIINNELTSDIKELAFISGTYSRYCTDKHFPKQVFKTLYSIWIENSLNGTIATDVLAYIENGKPLGIITYKRIFDDIEIGLVAVSSQSAGKGIGTKLMQHFLSLFPIGTKVKVATQKANTIACHYYEKNGYKIESVTNIYHIWLRKGVCQRIL